MKKYTVAIILSAFLGISAGSAFALDLGGIGKAIEGVSGGTSADGAAGAPAGVSGGGQPSLSQVKGNSDYAHIDFDHYYKKSSVKVLSKDPNNSKIQVQTYDFVGGRLLVTDYQFECELQQGSKSCDMYQTFLGSKTYDESTGEQTSQLGAGPREKAVKSTGIGQLAGKLYKQETGKNPPEFY